MACRHAASPTAYRPIDFVRLGDTTTLISHFTVDTIQGADEFVKPLVCVGRQCLLWSFLKQSGYSLARLVAWNSITDGPLLLRLRVLVSAASSHVF